MEGVEGKLPLSKISENNSKIVKLNKNRQEKSRTPQPKLANLKKSDLSPRTQLPNFPEIPQNTQEDRNLHPAQAKLTLRKPRSQLYQRIQ